MQMTIASLTLTLLLIACSAGSIAKPDLISPTPTLTTAVTEIPTAILISFLSQESGIPTTEITLQRAEAVNWNDSCLGVSQFDELCAQVITPGYRITFDTPRGSFVVHSDRSGRWHRLAQSP
jgi:hypothetical protein